MDIVQYVLLWATACASTGLYLYKYDVQVKPASMVALVAWSSLAFRGGSIERVSRGEPVSIAGASIVQAFCVFLALVSGFVLIANWLKVYPTEEMVNDPNSGDSP